MKNHDIDFAVLGGRIKEILYEYVKIQSFTNTEKKKRNRKLFSKIILTKLPISENIMNSGEPIPLKMILSKEMYAGPW